MSVLGSGNLMFMASLIVYLNEYTQLSNSNQLLITTAIPLAIIPIVVGAWAKLLDNHHVFYFRAIHSWGFVIAISVFFIAEITGLEYLLFVGACCYGFTLAGSVIGWDLGHNDFVGDANPIEFMAINVCLSGIRGLIAPILGISFYQWLQSSQNGDVKYALLLPLIISIIGSLLFVWYNAQRNKQLRRKLQLRPGSI